MRGAKFFGVVIACILTLLLAVEAGSISVAWADKPPEQGKKPPEGQTLPWGVDRIDADKVGSSGLSRLYWKYSPLKH